MSLGAPVRCLLRVPSAILRGRRVLPPFTAPRKAAISAPQLIGPQLLNELVQS